MTDLSELEWSTPVDDPTRPERTPKQCRHPKWERLPAIGEMPASCGSCGHQFDAAAMRRGRNNRARGLAIQRNVLRSIGMENIPYNAENHDGRSSMFSAEVKSGAAFPERFWRWLKGVPVGAEQTAILLVLDTPGPGKRRRGVVVVDLDDWISLHGKDGL